MKKITISFIIILFILGACKENNPVIDPKILSVSESALEFLNEGGTDTITIQTNATKWQIKASESWITTSVDSGIEQKKQIIVTVATNPLKQLRSAKLILSAPNADTIRVIINQLTKSVNGTDYPAYSNPIAADNAGMSLTVNQIARQMYMGWNLGNTLEVPGSETAWGNPLTTQLLIDSIKAAGFNAVRLPCAWDSKLEMGSDCKIKPTWLARVKEVVDYCYKNNMFVILNIHWDGGWLENNVTVAKQSLNNSKQRAIWEQIAMHFRNYDEHLLFAGTNEPNVDNATQMAVLMTYHQTFVDAVRSTGGKNAYRTLVIQGPSTDISKTNQLMSKMPTDNVPYRLMAEVHYYTPWNFCGMSKDETWGKMFYYWGANLHSSTETARNATYGEETDMKNLFALMKTKFADKGIPVILGEFGALRRQNLTGEALTLHLASRAYFYNQIAKQARNYGMIPFLWDTGIHNSYDMGIFDRNTGAVADRQAYNSLMSGAASGAYY